MPPDDLPKVNKWITEKRRIILPGELRGQTIHDLGLFDKRFRFIFRSGRFAEFVGDPHTKSGLSLYQPPRNWLHYCRDAWRLKYLTKEELMHLRRVTVKYLEMCTDGHKNDLVGYHWVHHKSGLPPHVFSAFNHFVFSDKVEVTELLKLPSSPLYL